MFYSLTDKGLSTVAGWSLRVEGTMHHPSTVSGTIAGNHGDQGNHCREAAARGVLYNNVYYENPIENVSLH